MKTTLLKPQFYFPTAKPPQLLPVRTTSFQKHPSSPSLLSRTTIHTKQSLSYPSKTSHRNKSLILKPTEKAPITSKQEFLPVSSDGLSRFVIMGAISFGFAMFLVGMEDQKALALGPEGPLMEEFWDNMRRYGLYILTVSTGVIYTISQPILELLKNPITAILVVIILGGSLYIVSQVVSAMVGVSEFSYEYGDGGISIAKCDASVEWTEDYMSNLRSASGNIFQHDSLNYNTKDYKIELKPLFSAFGLRAFAMTSLRSFLMFYLPLLEPRSNVEDDDDDFLKDPPEEHLVDLVVPLKKSLKQIIRETTVVTTRRVLERLAVHYVSRRMACKFLKDVPKSARRKAERGMPTLVYFCSVSRTTFRGHLLGVAASWLVQVGIEIYRCFSFMVTTKEELNKVDKAEQIRLLAKKVSGATARCGASLVFASIGAGIGATLFHPSVGQWIGCAVGDLAGPIIVSVCFEKVLHVDL
ncbi:hypothetical protein HHK36_003390 [Tetracentron sinense]|uniref:Uncharacterized protein ycf33 n=1 Tax=Tetracentron sinense TaxID=13715 RepID=A0A835DNW7_TETSI|nr:hypothetical protein HHK36_003390 [Tetracentron sinense]